jgi:hypothetical protein
MTPHTGIRVQFLHCVPLSEYCKEPAAGTRQEIVTPAIVVRMERDGSAGSTERSEAERGTIA